MINVSRHSLLSVSTAYHSCIGDSASDEQYQESVYSSYSGEHEKSHVEPEPITKEHYEQLRRSLANPSRLEPPNFRSDARERLARLSRVQFLEFAMDVHDEVARITGSKNNQEAVPSSASRTDLSPHRIEARKKIAHLRGDLLQDLMSDIFYELGRRYPKFNEARDSFEPETSTQPEDQSSFSKLPGVRTPLAQIDMNQNLSDLVMGGIMKKVADDLNARHVDTISGTMSVSEIITILGQHGCPNITAVLDLKQCGTVPIAAGGFGDIYQGRLRGGTEVAIKCPRFFVNKSELTRADLKAAARELHTWSKYNHPNVVRLLGVALFRDRIAMVSLWMKHGTMSQYISRTPDVDRVRLCREIANGVAYLHDMGTVHGDIKGLNVLISDDGAAKLIDFGNSRLKNSTLSFTGSQTTSSFSTRWTAPELLADGGPHTPEADVYALGMTILEIITGQVPFPEIKVEPAVITRVIIQKQHPQRPLDSIPPNKHGDALWAILVRCWSQNPLDRPLASEVASRIGKIKLVGLHSTAHPDEFGRLVSPGLARRFR